MADKVKHPRTQFLTSVGRFVAGDPTKPSDIGHGGKKRDKPQTFVALAINKAEPGVNALLDIIYNSAIAGYAQHANIVSLIQTTVQQYGFPGPFVAEPQRRPFAWKVQDGDWPANREKEGHAGCWIFHFSTEQAVTLVDGQPQPQLFPKEKFHLGQFGMIAGNVAINGLIDANCGVYLNPTFVYVMHDGPIIVTGPTAAQALAGYVPGAMPAGAIPFGQMGTGAPPVGQHAAPPPPPPVQHAPPPPPPPPVAETAEDVARKWGVQHHPGHRYDPVTNTYQPDQAPARPLPPPPPVGGPAAPVYGTYQPAGAPSTPAQYQGTASPTSAGYPPVQPHPAFTG